MQTRHQILLRKIELCVWLFRQYLVGKHPPRGGRGRPKEWRQWVREFLDFDDRRFECWLRKGACFTKAWQDIETRAAAKGFKSYYDTVSPDSVEHHVLIVESIIGANTFAVHQRFVLDLAAAFYGTF